MIHKLTMADRIGRQLSPTLNAAMLLPPIDPRFRLIAEHPIDHHALVGRGGFPFDVNGQWFFVEDDFTVSLLNDLDIGVVANGKDYYLYACLVPNGLIFKFSLDSTFPHGFTAKNSRKLGGCHTLCRDADGTGLTALPTGHPAIGFRLNDIIPVSVWCIKHRAENIRNEGMAYDERQQKWFQIYLSSDDGFAGVQSVFNATILDTVNWMDFGDRGGMVGVKMLVDSEFQIAFRGSNERTNIFGSADPVTTGGHIDTAGRRMISDTFLEDGCGAMWQWLLDQSWRFDPPAHTHMENLAATYTQNATTDPTTPLVGWAWRVLLGGKGSLHRQGAAGDVKLIAGAHWTGAAHCGSRGRHASFYRWHAHAAIGARFGVKKL